MIKIHLFYITVYLKKQSKKYKRKYICKFYKNMNHFFHSFGIFLTVISILVLIGSFIYGFFYTMFFQDNYYVDFNSVLVYIAFWAILLATGKSMVYKSSNSLFELENNKKGIGIANESK